MAAHLTHFSEQLVSHIAGAALIDDASLHEAKAILELANEKGVKIVVAFYLICVQADAVSDASQLPLITCL